MLGKIDGKAKEMKFAYASEFVSLMNAVRREATASVKAKKHEALGDAAAAETGKILSIINMKDEELVKYVHAKHQDRYADFEAGKITRLELIALTRTLLAKEEGLKKDTVNKYFGA